MAVLGGAPYLAVTVRDCLTYAYDPAVSCYGAARAEAVQIARALRMTEQQPRAGRVAA